MNVSTDYYGARRVALNIKSVQIACSNRLQSPPNSVSSHHPNKNYDENLLKLENDH